MTRFLLQYKHSREWKDQSRSYETLSEVRPSFNRSIIEPPNKVLNIQAVRIVKVTVKKGKHYIREVLDYHDFEGDW